MLAHSGDASQPDTDHCGDGKSCGAEKGRDRKSIRYQIVDRSIAVLGGKPQIAAHHITEVIEVLLAGRAVEFVAGEQLFFDGRRDLAFARKRTTRGEAHEEKGDGDYAKEHDDQSDQTTKNEREHRLLRELHLGGMSHAEEPKRDSHRPSWARASAR